MNFFLLAAVASGAFIACRPRPRAQDSPNSTCEAQKYLVPSSGTKPLPAQH